MKKKQLKISLLVILNYINLLSNDNKILIDKAIGNNSKGTILLIHGTAPQNIDGKIPIASVQSQLKLKDKNHYIIQPTYRDLSKCLNIFGWDTIRYTRLGVHDDHIDNESYAKTDLNNIMLQLNTIWSLMPKDKPKIIFAWSGGSIHALQLPLTNAAAIIILGGISTKRTDVLKLMAKNESDRKKIEEEINIRIASEHNNIKRTDMIGLDMPYGRFWDENRLADNWTYLKPYNKLPVLILHGSSDKEVSPKQALIWNEKLPNHNIQIKIKANGNHSFGTIGNQPDMTDLAKEINSWLLNAIKIIN